MLVILTTDEIYTLLRSGTMEFIMRFNGSNQIIEGQEGYVSSWYGIEDNQTETVETIEEGMEALSDNERNLDLITAIGRNLLEDLSEGITDIDLTEKEILSLRGSVIEYQGIVETLCEFMEEDPETTIDGVIYLRSLGVFAKELYQDSGILDNENNLDYWEEEWDKLEAMLDNLDKYLPDRLTRG